MLLGQLRNYLKDHRQIKNLVVAYSGGLDSTVLLHSVAVWLQGASEYSHLKLSALHVNHQLSDNAAQWQESCAQQCASLAVPITSAVVDLADFQGSLEDKARQARYQVFSRHLGGDDLLLMAHHQNDQVETLLFNIFRGNGLDGLLGMPAERSLGDGFLLRPFLQTSHASLLAYATAQQLTWVEDESNADVQFDRNFLRHQVIPLLGQRFVSLNSSLKLLHQDARVSYGLARQQLDALLQVLLDHKNSLDLALLLAHEPELQHALVRQWLKRQDIQLPSRKSIVSLLQQLQGLAEDKTPQLQLRDSSLQRYQQRLYVVPMPLTIPVKQRFSLLLLDGEVLEFEHGTLKVLSGLPGEANLLAQGDTVEVGFRHGGERCVLTQHGQHKSLKKMFQQWAVPPWLRPGWPLLFQDSLVIAVPHYFSMQIKPIANQSRWVQLLWQPR